MTKKLLAFTSILIVLGIVYANVFYPRLYIKGYNPLINNQILVYKIDKGMNLNKTKPYEISTFAPEKKEKIDFENQKVIVSTMIGTTKIAPDLTLSFDQYFANMQKKAFRQSLRTNILAASQSTQATPAGIFSEFELPKIAMPRAVQKVLGTKAGRLNLDGTQKITLQASSTKRKQIPIYETTNKSTFDLKMEQETNLRLTGTIGEKISVNMKYNSKQDEQFFDPNNLNIKYTGSEDEIIQSIEAGNITLALSGSRYISYSTSSQGLFGITSKWKFGDLNLTMIASKEEGQKNTQTYVGQSQADSTSISSKEYAPRNMYYIADPYRLYDVISGNLDYQGAAVPAGWNGNAINRDITGSWLLHRLAETETGFGDDLLPANSSVELYLDDGNYANNFGLIEGQEVPDGNGVLYPTWYELLIEGTDYVTDYRSGIIQLLRPIDRLTTLGVRYTRKDGVVVPANANAGDGVFRVKLLRRKNQGYNEYDPQYPDNQDPIENTWFLQMRNVYPLNKTNIKSEGFSLNVYTEDVDRTRNYNIPDSLSFAGIITYNDYLRLDSNGDRLINGDDATINLTGGMIVLPFVEPLRPLGEEIIYEEEHDSVSYQDITLFINYKGKIGRDAIELSQGGLLKGSVRVRVNGNTQRENVDYIVDYDYGRITFLTAAGKDPEAKIEIDYEFRSMFDVAKKSLAGVRADWNITDNTKLGGTFIYRSETVSDKRPKIGNENIELIMADVDGSFTVKPKFITRWLDALPLINTNAESRFSLSGEVAMTLPNIYGDPDGKKKIAYIDDMESIMDQYPLGVTFSTWVKASKPFQTSLAKARTIWYNDKNTQREDIENPETLTEREKTEYVTVMAVKVFPDALNMPGSNPWAWGGVMKYLGNELDFSQKKYIELLVKIDRKDTDPDPNPILRVDLGDINEDFYTDFGGYGSLNTEDKNLDGVLTTDEDLGLDGIKHGDPGHDPNDLADNEKEDNDDYLQINGTEGNRVLDTEDLDGNGVLNTLDRYYSYAVALKDTRYLEGDENHAGWRLYRIPINDPAAYQIVNSAATGVPPNLKKISYARIWLETDKVTKVLIADAAVVGNKWQDFFVRYATGDNDGAYIPDNIIAPYNTSYISGIVNNQKNVTHYVSPPGTVYIEDRKESSESAMTLTVNKLNQGHQVLLRQRLLDAYSLLSYDKIKLWVYPEAAENATVNPEAIDIVLRIGADSLNYYQVRRRVNIVPYGAGANGMDKDRWLEKEFTFRLQEFSNVKEMYPNDNTGSWVDGDLEYFFKGRPTLTNIREITLGVRNPATDNDSDPNFSGTIYFNDLRVEDPFEAIGWAKRATLNSVFADVMVFDVDYEEKSENFNPTIQRGRQNSFTETTSFNITNKYFLNKFFPNSWNLDIPISLYRNYSLSIPRYRTNSDLLREKIIDVVDSSGNVIDGKDREQSESLLYAMDFGFSQKVAPKNKFLLYTINRTSISGRIENGYRNNATSRDSTFLWRGTLNYNLNFPVDKVSFKLIKNYRIGFFPSSFTNSFNINTTQPKSWNWEVRVDSTGWYPRTQSVDTKVLTTDNGLTWNLGSDLTATARYNTKRDLMQKDYFKDINIGKETEFVQDLGLNFTPTYFPRLMNLTSSGTTKFTDYQRRYTQNTSDGYIEIFKRDGASNRTFRTNLTLMNSTLLTAWGQKVNAAHQQREQKKASDKALNETPKEQAQSPKEELEQQEPDKELDKELEKELDLKDEVLDESKEPVEPEQKPKQEENTSEPQEEKKIELSDEKLKDLMGGNTIPKDGATANTTPKDDEYSSAVSDSSKTSSTPKVSFYLPGFLISSLARIKNISTSYQNAYSMTYTQKENRPPFAFQLGLPHSIPSDSLDAKTDDNTITIGSGYTFSRNLDTVMNYSYSINRRYSNASTQSVSQTFPDVMLSLLDFERWLGIGKVLSGSRINSGFQYTVRQNGDIDWVKPKQETRTISLNPVIGLATNVMGVVTTNISYTRSRSENITDMSDYNIVKTMDAQAINGSVSYSYRAGRGFTIPFTKKKIHIKNELTSSLAVIYEQNFDETQGRSSSLVDRDTSKISFTPSASYQFNQDIKGGLTGSYEITEDKKRDDGTKIFRMGIWVELAL